MKISQLFTLLLVCSASFGLCMEDEPVESKKSLLTQEPNVNKHEHENNQAIRRLSPQVTTYSGYTWRSAAISIGVAWGLVFW